MKHQLHIAKVGMAIGFAMLAAGLIILALYPYKDNPTITEILYYLGGFVTPHAWFPLVTYIVPGLGILIVTEKKIEIIGRELKRRESLRDEAEIRREVYIHYDY
jgi:hypothetical protein